MADKPKRRTLLPRGDKPAPAEAPVSDKKETKDKCEVGKDAG